MIKMYYVVPSLSDDVLAGMIANRKRLVGILQRAEDCPQVQICAGIFATMVSAQDAYLALAKLATEHEIGKVMKGVVLSKNNDMYCIEGRITIGCDPLSAIYIQQNKR